MLYNEKGTDSTWRCEERNDSLNNVLSAKFTGVLISTGEDRHESHVFTPRQPLKLLPNFELAVLLA